MRVDQLLDMAEGAFADRAAFSDAGGKLTYGELIDLSRRAATLVKDRSATALVYVAEASIAAPVAFFGASMAGVPFVPLNYRLAPAALRHLLENHSGALVVTDQVLDTPSLHLDEWWEKVGAGDDAPVERDGQNASIIYTSGTTSAPKGAILSHSNLVDYVLESVEFGSSDPDEASLVCLPPYHIAGVMSMISNLYKGRRAHFLPKYEPAAWVAAIEQQQITHATVVPTMLSRLLKWVDSRGSVPPLRSLRTLASGGAMLSGSVASRVMEFWPNIGLVNGYGLTETSSTVAVMDPDSYRAAVTSSDEAVRARIGSVGLPVPGVEIEVRRPDGERAAPLETGEIFINGNQVSGRYSGQKAPDSAWFATRDIGYFDEGGYLFVLGRSDDTIIRGGENIAPSMIEEVLLLCDGVSEAVVVGLPDEEWGQSIAAVVVPTDKGLSQDDLVQHCRSNLRSAFTPQAFHIWDELPVNDSGKIVRREIVRRLTDNN